MTLLEFHYWTDVVMFGIIITAISSVILVIVAIKSLSKKTPCDTDSDAKLRQEISDKLDIAIEDIKSTV